MAKIRVYLLTLGVLSCPFRQLVPYTRLDWIGTLNSSPVGVFPKPENCVFVPIPCELKFNEAERSGCTSALLYMTRLKLIISLVHSGPPPQRCSTGYIGKFNYCARNRLRCPRSFNITGYGNARSGAYICTTGHRR